MKYDNRKRKKMKELSHTLKQELESMGVHLFEIDESNLSKTKQFKYNCYIYDSDKQYTNHVVYIKDIVGTLHPSYEGLSFLDIFTKLKRRERIVSNYLENSSYYTEQLTRDISDDENDRPCFIKLNDEYYVDTGNHRITICKLKKFDYVVGDVTELIWNPNKQKLWDGYIYRGFKLDYDSTNDRLTVFFDDDYVYFDDRTVSELTEFLILYDKISIHKLGFIKNRKLRSQSMKYNYSNASFQFNRVFNKLLQFKKTAVSIS